MNRRKTWRAIAAGTLLGLTGCLLTLGGLALVQRSHTARFGPGVAPGIVDAARHANPPLDAGPEWRVVSDLDTPVGRVVRLRPHLHSTEVRGADCVIYLHNGSEGATERTPLSTSGDVGHPPLPGVRHERTPASVDWKGIAASLGGRPLAGGDLLHAAIGATDAGALRDLLRADPVVYVSLPVPGGTDWTLSVEASFNAPPPALARVLESLPWSNAGTSGYDPHLPRDPGDPRGMPDLSSGPVDLLLILDPSTLAVLEARDLRFHAAPGHAGRALVFDPNPVAYSGRTDLRDGDQVDHYRVWMDAPRLDGSGRLRGRWIETANDRPPLAREMSLVFAYPSYDPRFEEAMAYVHGDLALQRVEDLGFSGLFSSPLRLRVHGTTADNSWYSRATREIVYGSGGVDDAEDADIIIHEIGHAIHDAIVPGFDGGDTYAISEGFSDFWAASLTGGPCIGDWDATSYSPPCLRRTDTDAAYPHSLNGRPHNDGQIWSASLWDIRGLLGAEPTERLALASFLEQGTRTTFPEAAAGLMTAAERLGMHDSLHLIRGVLEDRGLLPRSIRAELLPHETHSVPLAIPGRILGGWTRSLVIGGDGRLFFPQDQSGVFSLPFPQGPPCIAPLARGDQGGAALHVGGSMSATRVDLDLEWRDLSGSLCRIDAVWNLDTGAFTWEYRHSTSPEAGLYFGASSGDLSSDLVVPIRLAEIPPSGMHGMHGFRADLGDSQSPDWLPNLVGARFSLTQDDEASGLRLQALASPLKPGRLTLVARPNPFHDSVQVRLRLQADRHADVSVFDVQGRRVRSLLHETLREGAHSVEWDGRDDSGRPLPSAVYWIRASAGEDLGTAGVLRLQ